MNDAKLYATPIEGLTTKPVPASVVDLPADQPYHQDVGWVIRLSVCTSPDILCEVGSLSQHSENLWHHSGMHSSVCCTISNALIQQVSPMILITELILL